MDYVEFDSSTIWFVVVVFLYVLVVDFIEFDCSTIVELDWILLFVDCHVELDFSTIVGNCFLLF